MKIRKYTLVLLCFTIVGITFSLDVYAQTPGLAFDDVITIEGEIQAPTAIISPSRARPEFIPATIDSVNKDYTESAFALLAELIAPVEEEIRPKKMTDFKELLAKERK